MQIYIFQKMQYIIENVFLILDKSSSVMLNIAGQPVRLAKFFIQTGIIFEIFLNIYDLDWHYFSSS